MSLLQSSSSFIGVGVPIAFSSSSSRFQRHVIRAKGFTDINGLRCFDFKNFQVVRDNRQRAKLFGIMGMPMEKPEHVEPSDKSVEIMRKFSEQYARRSGTYFCVDKGVTSVVIKGLADHKDSLGAPLCPCRHYDDKAAEAGQGFWNCPCVPMRERKECHCMLFLTPENDFAGQEQTITIDEIKESTANM